MRELNGTELEQVTGGYNSRRAGIGGGGYGSGSGFSGTSTARSDRGSRRNGMSESGASGMDSRGSGDRSRREGGGRATER